VHANTVAAWHKIEQSVLSPKEKRARLSYLQLIELAVVAGFRKAKFSLPEIRAAREYLQKTRAPIRSPNSSSSIMVGRYSLRTKTHKRRIDCSKPKLAVSWHGMN
jgi:hypothetical protein